MTIKDILKDFDEKFGMIDRSKQLTFYKSGDGDERRCWICGVDLSILDKSMKDFLKQAIETAFKEIELEEKECNCGRLLTSLGQETHEIGDNECNVFRYRQYNQAVQEIKNKMKEFLNG